MRVEPNAATQASISTEHERKVVGTLLLNTKLIEEVLGVLGEQHFSDPVNRVVYKAITQLADDTYFQSGFSVGMVTDHIAENNRNGDVCDAEVIEGLAKNHNDPESFGYHVGYLRQDYELRIAHRKHSSIVRDIECFYRDPEAKTRVLDVIGSGSGRVKDEIVLECFADIEPKRIEWLWDKRIAIGKFTLLVGDGGIGKSCVTIDMAARISTGKPFPDCQDIENPQGVVIFMGDEDGVADTVRPRLDGAGADATKILHIKGVIRASRRKDSFDTVDPISLKNDLELIDKKLADHKSCRMLVIDPLNNYMGKIDGNNDIDVRSVLMPLAILAERHNVAIVGICHLNKNSGAKAAHRVLGSVAYSAAGRSTWLVSKDPESDNPTIRLMLPLKKNIGKCAGGLRFDLVSIPSNDDHPYINWHDGVVDIDPDVVLGDRFGESKSSAVEEAKDFLKDLLSIGPMAIKKILKKARDAGVTKASLYRAKEELGITSEKCGFGTGAEWQWRLPPEPEYHEDAQKNAKVPLTEGDCAPSLEHGENEVFENNVAHLRGEEQQEDCDVKSMVPVEAL